MPRFWKDIIIIYLINIAEYWKLLFDIIICNVWLYQKDLTKQVKNRLWKESSYSRFKKTQGDVNHYSYLLRIGIYLICWKKNRKLWDYSWKKFNKVRVLFLSFTIETHIKPINTEPHLDISAAYLSNSIGGLSFYFLNVT